MAASRGQETRAASPRLRSAYYLGGDDHHLFLIRVQPQTGRVRRGVPLGLWADAGLRSYLPLAQGPSKQVRQEKEKLGSPLQLCSRGSK